MSGGGSGVSSGGSSGEKRSFRAQPAVKRIFVYQNGDPYSDARRVLIHEKRVCDLEALLREVTGRVRAPFGAVRTIYTPTAGHRVDSLDCVQNGQQYVAAGKEKFKKLDYLHIRNRKKQIHQNNGAVKPVPQSRIVVSARFLKPIKEPCAIFVVANGDVLNPAVRFLVPNRLLDQFERILEMITEKMGLRIWGGVRSLYTFDGALISEGKDLESGQFYVAVGRDKFKRLPYADSVFTKAVGMRRIVRSKAASLPPIERYAKQHGDMENSGSKAHGDEVKVKKLVGCLVREFSQARIMMLRKKQSGLTMSFSSQDNDDGDQKAEGEDEESDEKAKEEDPSSNQQENIDENEGAGEDEATEDAEEPEGDDDGAKKDAAAEEPAGDEEVAAADEEGAGEDDGATEEPAGKEEGSGEDSGALEEPSEDNGIVEDDDVEDPEEPSAEEEGAGEEGAAPEEPAGEEEGAGEDSGAAEDPAENAGTGEDETLGDGGAPEEDEGGEPEEEAGEEAEANGEEGQDDEAAADES